jgi:hypothetical protein
MLRSGRKWPRPGVGSAAELRRVAILLQTFAARSRAEREEGEASRSATRRARARRERPRLCYCVVPCGFFSPFYGPRGRS